MPASSWFQTDGRPLKRRRLKTSVYCTGLDKKDIRNQSGRINGDRDSHLQRRYVISDPFCTQFWQSGRCANSRSSFITHTPTDGPSVIQLPTSLWSTLLLSVPRLRSLLHSAAFQSAARSGWSKKVSRYQIIIKMNCWNPSIRFVFFFKFQCKKHQNSISWY